MFDAGVVYKEIFNKKDYTAGTVSGELSASSFGVNGDNFYLKLILENDFDLTEHNLVIGLGPIDMHRTTRFEFLVNENEVKVYERKLIDSGTLGEPEPAPQYRAHLSNKGKEITIGVEGVWPLASVNLNAGQVILDVAGNGLHISGGDNLAREKYGLR